jgi:hypothetical protein
VKRNKTGRQLKNHAVHDPWQIEMTDAKRGDGEDSSFHFRHFTISCLRLTSLCTLLPFLCTNSRLSPAATYPTSLFLSLSLSSDTCHDTSRQPSICTLTSGVLGSPSPGNPQPILQWSSSSAGLFIMDHPCGSAFAVRLPGLSQQSTTTSHHLPPIHGICPPDTDRFCLVMKMRHRPSPGTCSVGR